MCETSRSSRTILFSNSQKWEPGAFPLKEEATCLAFVNRRRLKRGVLERWKVIDTRVFGFP